jgi:hypothetical protein
MHYGAEPIPMPPPPPQTNRTGWFVFGSIVGMWLGYKWGYAFAQDDMMAAVRKRSKKMESQLIKELMA